MTKQIKKNKKNYLAELSLLGLLYLYMKRGKATTQPTVPINITVTD